MERTTQEILTDGHPALRTKCQPVEVFGEALHILLHCMAAAMHTGNGMGLAANQLGAEVRVFILNSQNWGLVEAVNPVLSNHMGATHWNEECLSVPNKHGRVKRARCVTLRYQDRCGARKTIRLAGIDAVCAQHELDHLDGVLFTDKLET